MNLGLVPTAILGHSLGEYVAAAVAEIVPLRGALTLVLRRAQLIREQLPPGEWGMMALSPQTWAQLSEAAAKDGVVVAAVNSPRQLVVSGPLPALRALEEQAPDGTLLAVPYGYHSPQLAPIVPSFLGPISGLYFSTPKFMFVSSVTGRPLATTMDHQHWVEHLLHPVQFQSALEYVRQRCSCATFLEVGPRPVLSAFGKAVAPEAEFLHSLHPKEPNQKTIVSTLASLYVLGFDVRFGRFYQGEMGVANSVEPPTVESPPESFGTVLEAVVQMLAGMTGYRTVSPSARLSSLGLDVVMLQQLQTELIQRFKCSFPFKTLMEATMTVQIGRASCRERV